MGPLNNIRAVVLAIVFVVLLFVRCDPLPPPPINYHKPAERQPLFKRARERMERFRLIRQDHKTIFEPQTLDSGNSSR